MYVGRRALHHQRAQDLRGDRLQELIAAVAVHRHGTIVQRQNVAAAEELAAQGLRDLVAAGLRLQIPLVKRLGIDFEQRPAQGAVQLPVQLAAKLLERDAGGALTARAADSDAILFHALDPRLVDIAAARAERPEELFGLVAAKA